MTTTILNTKIGEVQKEIYKLEILEQVNLVSKTDFDNKLISFNRKITSNKTNYLKVPEKLNSLTTTKDYNVFLGRTYFTSNDGSQNMFFINQCLTL